MAFEIPPFSLSSDLDELFPPLLSALYEEGLSPFADRLICIPHPFLKEKILQKIAQEKGVAFGLRFLHLTTAFQEISGEIIPSQMEMSLFIEGELLKEKELQSYLKGARGRSGGLADHLAQVFWELSLGGKTPPAGWVRRLFEKTSEAFPLPHKLKVQYRKPLFLFGFPFLPEVALRFFAEGQARGFFFSPSQSYFGDFASGRQVAKMGDAFLEDQHPLLANWGRLGRDMQKQIEDLGGVSFDSYPMPEGRPLLSALQSDLLMAAVEKKESAVGGIDLFSAPSALREIEVLKQKLLPHLKEGVKPEEILILAPSIAEYAHLLKAVFEEGEHPVPCSILGLPLKEVEEKAGQVEKLFSLVEESFSIDAVSQFLKAIQFPERGWIEKGSLRNVEEDLFRLIEQGASVTEWEGLNAFVCLIEELKKDLAPFSDQELRSAKIWLYLFASLIEKYVTPDPAFSPLSELRRLAQSAISEALISYESAKRCLDNFLSASRAAMPAGQLEAITCLSFQEGALYPAKVIAAVGLSETFPSRQNIPLIPDSGLPTKTDREQYLFLQMLLSAKNQLFLSYTGEISPLLEKLKTFMRQSYGAELEEEKHPLLSTDRRYFTGELKSYSHKAYKAHLFKNDSNAPLFSSFYKKETFERKEPFRQIEISHLLKCARHPLRYFFHEILGFYPETYSDDPDRGAFVQSALDRKKWIDASLFHNEDTLPQLPDGKWGKIAEKKVQEEIEEKREKLIKLGVGMPFTLLFHPYYKKWTKLGERLYALPPVKIGKSEIIGKLENVTDAGFLHRGKDLLPDWIECLPVHLILKEIPEMEQALISIEKGKISEEKPAVTLEKYIEYFSMASAYPSPFMPKLAYPFFFSDSAQLEKDLKGLLDATWNYLFMRDPLPNASAMLSNWEPYLPLFEKEGLSVV